MGVPNPLFYLINIHDDEESSKISLVTMIPIKEEKEPGGTSSPSPDALVPNPLQGDHEADNVLDSAFLNLSETPKDSSRDDIGSRGQK
jgi:hypothetical protein